jgi:phosphate-selective porin
MERSHEKGLLAVLSAAVVLLLLLAAPAIAGDENVPAATSEQPGFNLAELAKLEQLSGNGGAEETEFPLQAGYSKDEGFFISDKEKEHFLLKIGGRLQLRYTYKGRDKRGDTVDPGEVGGRDQSYLEVERLRLTFGGHVIHPNLTYFVQIGDGDTDSAGTVRALDAYVLYHAGEALGGDKEVLSLGVGQFMPYFLRQQATSSGKLQMVERSLTNEFFNIDRNVGVWIQGILKPSIFYSFAVTNGFDSINVTPDNIDQVPAFVGKLDFWVLGEPTSKYEESNLKEKEEWVIGLSGATDWNNGTGNPVAEQYSCYTFGIDTAFKYSLFSLQAEYVGRWLDYEQGNVAAGGDGSSNYTHGLYVQGGVFLVPNELELAARVSTIWADGSQDGDAVEVGPGLNWYISKSHKVKLQTDLMFFDISANMPNQTESLEVNDIFDGDFNSSAANLQAGEQGLMWRTQLQLEF